MNTIPEIKAMMKKVNDYWIGETPAPGDCAWERAAYYLGNMAAFEVLQNPAYLQRAVDWANENHWDFYNNAGHDTTNADNISCGETYLDLLVKYHIPGDWTPMKETLATTAADPVNNYWWWIDTMYMALNFYNRAGLYLKDRRLLDKAYKLFINSKVERRCYDEEEHLWFRDEDFLPEKARTQSGKKVFWARGNGWVLAGLARTLRTLPADDPYYEEYRKVFVPMADAICCCQSEDGFWRTSLLEPEEFPMPETSGTALNVLGLLIGVNLGLLGKEHLQAAVRGFEALNREAVEPSGRIGWVQIVALKPGPVKKECTNDYAVGTYLCLCRELIQWIKEHPDETV